MEEGRVYTHGTLSAVRRRSDRAQFFERQRMNWPVHAPRGRTASGRARAWRNCGESFSRERGSKWTLKSVALINARAKLALFRRNHSSRLDLAEPDMKFNAGPPRRSPDDCEKFICFSTFFRRF